MNYLAHVFLQRSSPDLLIGGLLGDFVKGALDARFNPTVQAGILLHRAIDRYTDRAPNGPHQHCSHFSGSSALCRNPHRCVL